MAAKRKAKYVEYLGLVRVPLEYYHYCLFVGCTLIEGSIILLISYVHLINDLPIYGE